LTDTD